MEGNKTYRHVLNSIAGSNFESDNLLFKKIVPLGKVLLRMSSSELQQMDTAKEQPFDSHGIFGSLSHLNSDHFSAVISFGIFHVLFSC